MGLRFAATALTNGFGKVGEYFANKRKAAYSVDNVHE